MWGRRSGQRLPFSPRADNTLAAVRLYPVEANVEGGAAGPARRRAAAEEAAAPVCGKSGESYRLWRPEVERR